MGAINWMNDIDKAKKEAKERGKHLFFFFHHPQCDGCKKTINDTFVNREVIGLLNEEFIPLAYLVTESPDIAGRYKIDWTPTFIIADADGNELERWVGYLPPEDFMAQIELCEGLASFRMDKYHDAEMSFEKVITKKPDAEVAPEARYFLGVAHYKESGDASYLKEACAAMKSLYPGDNWTKRASVWC